MPMKEQNDPEPVRIIGAGSATFRPSPSVTLTRARPADSADPASSDTAKSATKPAADDVHSEPTGAAEIHDLSTERKRRRKSKRPAKQTQATPGITGKDKASLDFALREIGWDYRFDLRASRPQLRCMNGSQRCEWVNVDDRLISEVQEQIGAQFTYPTHRGPAPLHFGRERLDTSFNALLYHKQVDPFREWVEDLAEAGKQGAWDRKPRLDTCVAECFDLEPTQDERLAQWAITYLTVGAIQRAFDPGKKMDEIPVFVGPTDIGKSTFLRELLPPAHQSDWFTDSLNLSGTDQQRIESLLGKVIVEISEMAGSTRAEIESLKAFLSRQVDNMRLSYRRNPETLPRRCVIAGTTNSKQSLPNDPTGLRRFVPVVLTGGTAKRIRDYMDANRDQLWLEALYSQGLPEPWQARLPDELKECAAEAAEEHRRRDDIPEDGLAKWLDQTGKAEFTTRQACFACGYGDKGDKFRSPKNPSKADEMRVTRALEGMGYSKGPRKRRNGSRVSLWRRTDGSDSSPDSSLEDEF